MSLSNFCDSECTKCNLHRTATRVCVSGKGAESDIKMLIVGEAPGTDENKLGECFIGKAGQLLQSYLETVEVDLGRIRFENLVRCFPQDSNGLTRQPTNEEARECLPYFYSIITSILADQEKTPVIVALGNFALKTLTGNAKITTNRGTFFPLIVPDSLKETFGYLEEMDIQVMGTIHPSAVLRGTTAYEPKIIADLSYAWKVATDSVGKYWTKYKWVDDPDIFSEYVDRAISRHEAGEIPWIAYDLETTGLEVYDTKNHKTVCFSLCMEDEKAIVVPLYHKDCPYLDDSFVMERVINDLKRLLIEVPIAGWGLVFDVKWTKLHLGIDIKEVGFDGYLARRWLYGSEQHNDLNSVAAEELNFYGHGNDIWSEVKNLPKESQNFSNVSKDTLLIYAGGDADATFRLCKTLEETLDSTNTLESFKSLSIAGVLPICKMEMDGVFINETTNSYLRKKYPEKMKPLVDFILNTEYGKKTQQWLSARKDKKGKPSPLVFNIASSTSLQRLIFEEMGMPIRESGKSGPAANREIVEELIEYCNTNGFDEEKKILEAINEWRTHKHTYTNFIKNIPEYTQWDGFFHTQYNIAGTECMPAGELVLTDRGWLPVEQVVVGDKVLTHKGRARSVISSFPNGIKSIFKITLDNDLSLRTTGNHEYFHNDAGWVEASSLRVGDEVRIHCSDVEQWKVIEDWPNFSVSSWGRIRNNLTGKFSTIRRKNSGNGRKFGHLSVLLYRNGSSNQPRGKNKKDVCVHTLVLNEFTRKKNKGEEARHLNNLAWDNNINNLKWCTRKENVEDQIKFRSLSKVGNNKTKLNWEKVDLIRSIPRTTLSDKELSIQFGVSRELIRDVRNGIRWIKTTDPPTIKFNTAKVVKIEIEPEEMTFGLVVEEDHSHVTGGIVTHNTGRFSTSKPSLHGQQKGSEAREQFVSRWIGKGGLIVSGDMSQMEMRVLAALSGDKNLIGAITSGVDLHTANASKMFKIPTEKVDKKQRDHAKRSGFGVVYGIAAETLATRLECNVAEARTIINIWYETFPDTLIFQKQEFARAKKFGCVYTPFGRFRMIPDIGTAKWGDKAWRRSINTNIQSSASDITYTSLLHAHKLFDERELQSKIFGFVHDSIIVDVYPGEVWEVLDILNKSMVEWANETYEWMKGLVKADYEICTAWGLPCSVDKFEKEKVVVHGPEKNIMLLGIELQNTDTINVINSEELGPDEFSLEMTRTIPF